MSVEERGMRYGVLRGARFVAPRHANPRHTSANPRQACLGVKANVSRGADVPGGGAKNNVHRWLPANGLRTQGG